MNARADETVCFARGFAWGVGLALLIWAAPVAAILVVLAA